MRSLSAEHTFESDILDKRQVVDKLEELANKLHKRVISSDVKFKVVSIKVRFTHFQTYTRENTLAVVTDSKDVMVREAKNLFGEFGRSQKKVSLIGLSVSGFVKNEQEGKASDLEEWI